MESRGLGINDLLYPSALLLLYALSVTLLPVFLLLIVYPLALLPSSLFFFPFSLSPDTLILWSFKNFGVQHGAESCCQCGFRL